MRLVFGNVSDQKFDTLAVCSLRYPTGLSSLSVSRYVDH